MSYLSNETRDEIVRLAILAEERLATLKSVALSAKNNEDISDLRIAIDDVKTPLSLAYEALS